MQSDGLCRRIDGKGREKPGHDATISTDRTLCIVTALTRKQLSSSFRFGKMGSRWFASFWALGQRFSPLSLCLACFNQERTEIEIFKHYTHV